jgi:digeranylgeranylglycerophospholipid reductase
MRRDFVVVGNGPAGSFSAMRAAAGHDTCIVGLGQRRIQCAGLISKEGMERMGVSPAGIALNTVRGARIFSPGGVEVEVDGGGPKAYAVDRLLFDGRVLGMARDAGAEYVEGCVDSLDGGVRLGDGSVIRADRTVLATGSNYTLQIRHGIPRPREFLVGGQYEMRVDCDPAFVELHFVVPGFFAWVIPLGDRARVGLCVKGNPRPHLDAFVKRLEAGGRLRSDRVLAESFGIIPIHDPAMPTQWGDVVTVGDAAGQVKATTGGGIVFGALAAKHICEPGYDRLWRRELGFDLRMHLLVHRLINRMSDRGKDRFFGIVKDARASLARSGDMDSASKTAQAMLKDPRFLAETAYNLPWLAWEML